MDIEITSSLQQPQAVGGFMPLTHSRITALRAQLKTLGVEAFLVRATDRFLSEYVPSEQSTREWLTGFTGSMGDALITASEALLFVDGRYTLQAHNEAPGFVVVTAAVGQSIEGAWLAHLAALADAGVRVVGLESERVSAQLFATVEAHAKALGLSLRAFAPSPIESIWTAPQPRASSVWPISPHLSGRSVAERLALVAPQLQDKNLAAQLVVALDELAWTANLRGADFAHQATFRGVGVLCADELIVAFDGVAPAVEPEVRAVSGDVRTALQALKGSNKRVGYDPRTTPQAMLDAMRSIGIEPVPHDSPLAHVRTLKTDAELRHMQKAFARADAVVTQVQTWLNTMVTKRSLRVTEADVAKKTEELFTKSGALGLSFKVISAAGKNGAVIHYSNPDATTPLVPGQLFLLDTGAYYEGGYATDLTRTFLLGKSSTKATKDQRFYYTVVLKAAIAGMSAVLPKEAPGELLDTLVREVMWRHGLDYGHGTGHGVGVNVHEAPPRIAVGSRVPLSVGQVFSIEPGVYLPEFGGVRIENLCTVVDDPRPRRAGMGRALMRVKPLTFSPLDMRLVDRRMLSAHERGFVRWFRQNRRTPLPPTTA